MQLFGKEYQVINTLEYITLADSFIKENKIGSGHGEARLYIGNAREQLFDFFEDFNDNNCLFCKKDFKLFLEDARQEYINPQQDYLRKDNMAERFKNHLSNLDSVDEEFLKFKIERYMKDDKNRVYIYVDSKYWEIMRAIALPNISYLSVLKLKDKDDKFVYYFRIFIDYKFDVNSYQMPEEKEQQSIIEDDKTLSKKQKDNIVRARVGQGEYRNKLLEECPFCPFTMVNDERLLIASHIKPWAKSNNDEKIDSKNGFAFTPTYDKLFDRGFITFDDERKLLVSPWLSPMNQKRLGIYTGLLIAKLPLDNDRKEYLKYHREFIFKA